MTGRGFPVQVRVLVVIDVRLYREGMTDVLTARDAIVVAGSAANRADALAAVRDRQADVVIVDVALDESLDLIRELQAGPPAPRVLAFAVREDISAILECADAGAAGYVTADASMDELVAAIQRAAAGELLCSPRITAELFRRAARGDAESDTNEAASSMITTRERQIWGCLKQGLSNKEIASALNISEATVKNHVHHLLEKLQVSSRGQAAARSAPWPRRVSAPLARTPARQSG